jgi:CubicO group peptidase (beta-lactamase class C family)
MSFSMLEQFIFEKMAKTKLPGLSAAAIKNGEIIWSKGFGFRDISQGLPMTPHTLCAIGSVTKSFTAVAILQLVEQGKIHLEDPIDKFFPFDVRPEGEPIRVWHLLTHSSGIPALAYAESMIRHAIGAGENWLPIASYSDMLAFMQNAQDWAISSPGSRWFYLNEGYVLLSYIIEKTSEMPYAEYVRINIFEPLGMKRSFFEKSDVDRDADVATPYIITQSGESIPSSYPYGLKGDGGIISNVLDLAEYIKMYLNWGKVGEHSLLKKESIESMEVSRVDTPILEGPFGHYGYGYGWGVISDFLGETLIGHSGSVGVATAYAGFIHNKGIGITLLSNGGGYPLAQMGMYGLAFLMGKNPNDLPFVRRENALEELEGVYETYKATMVAYVKKVGDFLIIEIRDKYNTISVPLIPAKIEENVRTFYTYTNGNKMEVEFRIENEAISVIYERYYLKRTGKLIS